MLTHAETLSITIPLCSLFMDIVGFTSMSKVGKAVVNGH